MGTISFKHTACVRACVCVHVHTVLFLYYYYYFSSHSLEALLHGDGCMACYR